MENVKLGDILENGSVVDIFINVSAKNKNYYMMKNKKSISNIFVSGDQFILNEKNEFVLIKEHPEALITDIPIESSISLVTSDHKIHVGTNIFCDWEDDLITRVPRPGQEKLYEQFYKNRETVKNYIIDKNSEILVY